MAFLFFVLSYHHFPVVYDVDAGRQFIRRFGSHALTEKIVDCLRCIGLFTDIFNTAGDTSQSAYKAGVSMFAVSVKIPDTHRSIGTPSALLGRIFGTPLAYAPLLFCRHQTEVLLYDPL